MKNEPPGRQAGRTDGSFVERTEFQGILDPVLINTKAHLKEGFMPLPDKQLPRGDLDQPDCPDCHKDGIIIVTGYVAYCRWCDKDFDISKESDAIPDTTGSPRS